MTDTAQYAIADYCPACGGPPRTSEGHPDKTCPLTRIPGRVQRGGRPPRQGVPDCVDVPLDEADPWDTGGSLVRIDGWPTPVTITTKGTPA